MSLKCPKCGGRNTVTETAGKIAELTRYDRFLTTSAGYISPEQLSELLKNIITAIKRFFGFLEQRERNNASVLICKSCGYYERI